MYAETRNAEEHAKLIFDATRSGVLSWNTYAHAGRLAFRLLRAHIPATDWLDYAEWNDSGRRSFSPQHQDVRVDTDIIHSEHPFDGIEVRAPEVPFNLVAFSGPIVPQPSLPYMGDAILLDVPARSQYIGEERGWCSPASLSMIHTYHGIDISVAQTAAQVFDREYNGTGNWSFNVAASGHLGFRAVVAHLKNLDHAHRCIERNIPLVISYGWSEGELPGAPLPHSDGHLAVLRGFTSNGDCAMNDSAHPALRTIYPRSVIEQLWQRSGGVAYVIAPVGIDFADILV